MKDQFEIGLPWKKQSFSELDQSFSDCTPKKWCDVDCEEKKGIGAPFFLPIVSIFFHFFLMIIPRMVLLGTKTYIIAAKREAGNGSPVSFFDCTWSQHECEGISWLLTITVPCLLAIGDDVAACVSPFDLSFMLCAAGWNLSMYVQRTLTVEGGRGRRDEIKNHTRKKWYDIEKWGEDRCARRWESGFGVCEGLIPAR